MSRRKSADRRTILPDPKFGSEKLAKFMNMVMERGKKSTAEGIVYEALDVISGKKGGDAMEILDKALDNRSEERRVGKECSS